MKLFKSIFLLSVFLFAGSLSYGAIPIKVQPTKTEVQELSNVDTPPNEVANSGSSTGKSQLTALLLCIFVGTLGIHRFYLGYTGIGVIQLLTLGGLGVWTIIDLIFIITGDLQPKDGEYATTL